MAIDVTKTRLTNYTITYDGVDLGAVDVVEITHEYLKHEIKVGSLGAVTLGNRLVGLQVSVRAELREITIATIRKLMPWYTTGSIALFPATTNKDEYDYGKLLTLHPIDMGAVTDEDLNYRKAVALFRPVKRDGESKEFIDAIWSCYPDRALLPVLNYGYVGPNV